VSESWNDLMKERYLKIESLRSGGRNPWPNDQARGGPTREPAPPLRCGHRRNWQRGRSGGRRRSGDGSSRFGKAAFLVLSDRSGRLQAYLKKDHLGRRRTTFS